MSELAEQVRELLSRAAELPEGHAKVALIEEAVRLADAHADLDLGYKARKKLLDACLGAGQGQTMILAFSWCLAQTDREPERFGGTDVYWEFRWVVSELATFPEVGRGQIEGMLADMRRRYEAAGLSLRAYHLLRRYVGMDLGDPAVAAAADADWKLSPRDASSDSVVTEVGFDVRYHVFKGETEEALDIAMPILSHRMRSEHFDGFVCANWWCRC